MPGGLESIHRYRATGDTDEIPVLKVGRSLRVPRVRLERHIGAPITWPIVDRPSVDHRLGPTDCDDDTRTPSHRTTTRHPHRTTRRPPTPRLFED